MAITRYQPWSVIKDLQGEMNKLFDLNTAEARENDFSNVITSRWKPHVDVIEKENEFVILADLPGVNPDDIHVSMDNGVLTIEGEKLEETEHAPQTEGQAYHYERFKGTFCRRFTLPETADGERIDAASKHGVLEVTIPKIERSKPQKIKVRER